MKTLTIQQPFASLVCCGIKDVENRSWQTKTPPGRILIHAGGKKVPKNFDIDEGLEAKSLYDNLKQFGIIPEFEDMPLSAIIGYVDVTGFAASSKSFWAIEGATHWLLENAYLFDTPICNVKGKLGLFDYEIDQNELPPAHKMKAALPVLTDTKLTVYVCDKDWEKLKDNPTEYTIDVNNRVIADIICKKNSTNPKPVTEIVFVHNKQRKTFEVKQAKRTKEYSRIGKDFQYKNLYYVTYNLGTSSQKAGKPYMQVAVRCIYYMAVTPSCDVIDMNEETWNKFRFADSYERKQIVLELLGKEYMSDKIKEIVWIPLNGQNILYIAPNYEPKKEKRSKK